MDQQRYHALDFVRAAAMLLGLSLHVNIFFMSENHRFWSSGEYHGDPINEGISFFIFQFRMPLFFILAGFFAALVIERKGLRHLVADRLKRILIPFLAGIMIMAPMLNLAWCINTSYENVLEDVSFVGRVQTVVLWGLFSDRDLPFTLPLLHLWFLYFLLIFYVVHFVVRGLLGGLGRFLERCSVVPMRACLTRPWCVFLLALTFTPLRYTLNHPGIGLNQLDVEINVVAIYGAYYLFGVLLYAQREHLAALAKNGWIYLFIALPIFTTIAGPTGRMINSASVVTDITNWKASGFSVWTEGFVYGGWFKVVICYLKDLACFSLCFAFIGLAHRYINRENRYTRYLADSSYWAYWVHVFIMFPVACRLQELEGVSSLLKAYFAFSFCTVVVYFLYQRVVRYTVLGDFFMGRRKSLADPAEASFRVSRLLALVARPACLVGLLCGLVGSMLHQDSLREKGHLIVEAFVTRDCSTLEQVERVDDAHDSFGNTPLHVAVRTVPEWRRYDPVPLLIEKTKDLDCVNNAGRTALFEAVRGGNRGDVEKLLDAGCDIHIADDYGHTPAHVAAILSGASSPSRAADARELLKLLRQHGADFDRRDYKNRTVQDCLDYFGQCAQ